ncbi:hypothetical protein DXN05_10375 [Deminuibacter soli]|uniref:PIN domain-containing protein n=1 Tax=Deminuibacter soli TaxID=2291815 RepID=A0A3E1NJE7_9BACT|nr:hypothetical protein DXN05_10375 [Deminuibacter soli]
MLMTGSKFLINTSIIIDVFDGNNDIAEKINKLGGFYISSIVLGKLYIGINRVDNKTKHLKKLNDFYNFVQYGKSTVIPLNGMEKLLPYFIKKANPFH